MTRICIDCERESIDFTRCDECSQIVCDECAKTDRDVTLCGECDKNYVEEQ